MANQKMFGPGMVVALVLLSVGGMASAAEMISPEMASRLIELREQGLESRNSFALVRSLTTEVGPRFAGTPGDRAAVEWAVRTMQEIGLENVRAFDGDKKGQHVLQLPTMALNSSASKARMVSGCTAPVAESSDR